MIKWFDIVGFGVVFGGLCSLIWLAVASFSGPVSVGFWRFGEGWIEVPLLVFGLVWVVSVLRRLYQ